MRKDTRSDNDLIIFAMGEEEGSVRYLSSISGLSEAEVLAASKDDIVIELSDAARARLITFLN